ncbi:MAG: 30S ribosomal protein S20 [Polyangiaceae bacterium]
MANHPSAEKRNRQRITRTTRNRTLRSSVRTVVKQLRAEIAAKNVEKATASLKTAISELDQAVAKKVMHHKAASRTIGRLSAAVYQLGKSGGAPAEAAPKSKAKPRAAKPAAAKPAAKKS